LDEGPIKGPVGPHLFRSSIDSTDLKSSLEVDFILAKTPTTAVFLDSASKLEPERKDTPLPGYVGDEAPQTQLKSINKAVSQLDEAEVRSWSPQDVVTWMQNVGFDDSIVEKFFINDISGAILLELQAEDLKELDIHSFGKRHRLMNSIQHLRNSSMISSSDLPTPLANSPTKSQGCSPNSEDNSSSTSEEEKRESTPKRHRRRHNRRRNHEDIVPGDSASIVAIEQILPKLHRCSKGEACRKWQRQQRKLARLAKGLPIDSITGSTILTGDPGNPATAPNLLRLSKSEMSPSVVASSDLLGPDQTPDFRLCEEKLNEVRPRDPQENVRHFLNFQHLSRLKPVNDPATPPRDTFPSPDVDSPDSVKTTTSLTENLRHLPRLTIPMTKESVIAASLSANVSAQRTVTPSILRKKPNFAPPSKAPSVQQTPFTYGQEMSPADYYRSPSDFYRSHDLYRQETPFSEADIPVTAIPLGPIPREVSQSVPPDMRFGQEFCVMADPVPRPESTKTDNHRRRPSLNLYNRQSLDRVDERQMAPIDSPEDLQTTPRSGPGYRFNDITHSGWMKKRKTTRLLRHEWEEHHFTLKGTQLTMYEDEQTARRDSKALEYIDVDDYAVACSSFASRSKLTAAFKKTVLKRKDTAHDEAAFAFCLIPATNGSNPSVVDRKAFFLNSGKTHHFAVKTRDERIDWMRELMLAKALKRGKESGDAIRLNGNVF
jgi:hypothetical protein